MGGLVKRFAKLEGIDVGLVLDGSSNRRCEGLTRAALTGIDVAIDFSRPDCAFDNASRIVGLQVDLVIGTTGWYERLDELRDAVKDAGTGVVYGPNFSVGANVFFNIVESVAALMRATTMFEPYLLEKHHKAKLDSPSGTAMTLLEILRSRYQDEPVPHAVLQAGYTAGHHEVGFDSPSETVIVRHTARNKDANAQGALFAARWIRGRKGCFPFREVLATSASGRSMPFVSLDGRSRPS
jgi:4-hydroxy-tetrahydrodipicolinate reductase